MKTYFEIFNIEKKFALDLDVLESKYLALQQQFHPDKLVQRSEGEKLVLASLSVDVNAGYHILKSPLNRAEYLLEINGIIVNQDAKDTVKPSQATLMEALEMREEISDVNDVETLKKHESELKTKISGSVSEISAYIDNTKGHNFLEKAANETIRLKYLTKLLDDVKLRRKNLKK